MQQRHRVPLRGKREVGPAYVHPQAVGVRRQPGLCGRPGRKQHHLNVPRAQGVPRQGVPVR